MPELPEVETMRRGILEIVGSRVTGIEIPACTRRPISIHPRLPTFRKRAIGQAVTAVDRLGKRVVVRLSNDDCIVFEPRMTGLVLVSDAPTLEHRRFRMDLAGGSVPQIWYWDRRGLGSVRLYSAEELQRKLGEGSLGPDALSISPLQFRERLQGSRREIKVALLDQRAVAGIGNLYAAEILHLAGVHPRTRCNRLRRVDWDKIYAAMHAVLNDAIAHEGSTLSDGTYRNALSQAGGYQNHHQVYDRAGELCLSCRKHSIERIVQAQRSTFYCRGCQVRRK